MGRSPKSVEQSVQPGYVYLFQFDNGAIKVGRTDDPHARRERHLRDSGRYGLSIVNRWISPRQANAVSAERRLIANLDLVAERTPAGREYYRGIPFTIARRLAESPVNDYCPTCYRPGVYTSVEMRLSATAAGQAIADPDESQNLCAEFVLECGGRLTGDLNDPDLGPAGRYPLKPGLQVELEVEFKYHGRWDVWAVHPAEQAGAQPAAYRVTTPAASPEAPTARVKNP